MEREDASEGAGAGEERGDRMRSQARGSTAAAAERRPAARVWRWPPGGVVALAALFVALLLVDALLYRVTLPVTITEDDRSLTIVVAGASPQRLPVGGRIVAVTVPSRDPLVHEYQIDDTDSTNNFTLDTSYLNGIATTPYYRFYAWMRDLDGLSRWRDLCAGSACIATPPLSGARLAVPSGVQRITAQLQRPETPVALALTMSDRSVVTLTIDRNNRAVVVTRALADQPPQIVTQTFFPTDAAPFAAMAADFVVRVALWAVALLALICGGEWLLGLLLGALGLAGARADAIRAQPVAPMSRWRRLADALTDALHPIGWLALVASFAFTVWIALAQYHALPHIYDASAYLFGAKTFAEGRLYAPTPSVVDRFPGPFMVVNGGKWFTQYEPGTSLTLAAGVLVGTPWLVEPLMGTLALLGVGLVARRLYDRRVATLAVLLGALSPFYSYLAAAYLSHAIALCYLVWGWWALLRSLDEDRRAPWYLPLAGLLWLLAALTRDTSVIFAAIATGGAAWLYWLRADASPLSVFDWRRWRGPALALLGVIALGYFIYFGYNGALTGNASVTPRMLFYPADHYGFGAGIGFFGQHTLAAGLVNLDELLTSLAIDLYGWPFYLTLAFLLIPFLTRRARPADVVMLLGAAAMTLVFVGYFYHGVYLGPRYWFEALPFLLTLTARGLVTLAEVGARARAIGASALTARAQRGNHLARSLTLTGALAVVLLACLFGYFLPRQIRLHTDFTGMDTGRVVQMATLANPPLRHALVMTGDSQLYDYTLFGLNDPLLRGNVIYAEADSAAQYAELHHAFPDRKLYVLVVGANGALRFIPVTIYDVTP